MRDVAPIAASDEIQSSGQVWQQSFTESRIGFICFSGIKYADNPTSFGDGRFTHDPCRGSRRVAAHGSPSSLEHRDVGPTDGGFAQMFAQLADRPLQLLTRPQQ